MFMPETHKRKEFHTRCRRNNYVHGVFSFNEGNNTWTGEHISNKSVNARANTMCSSTWKIISQGIQKHVHENLCCFSHTVLEISRQLQTVFRGVRKIVDSDYWLCQDCLFICPHGIFSSHGRSFVKWLSCTGNFYTNLSTLEVFLKSNKNSQQFTWMSTQVFDNGWLNIKTHV